MADFLTFNELKKVRKGNDEIAADVDIVNERLDIVHLNSKFSRPTHLSNRVNVTGGNNCCVCVPDTASSMIIEMWGGGGSGQSHCCQHGGHGGQGGSYGVKTVDLNSVIEPHTLCITPGAGGAANCCYCMGLCGDCSVINNCTTTDSYIVHGGHAGWNYCCCQNSNYCISQGGSPLSDSNNLGCGSGYSACSHGLGFGTFDCAAEDVDAFEEQSTSNTNDSLSSFANKYFPKGTCSNFDEYRCGMCGWSECGCTSCQCFGCCNWGTGNAGGSYAGASFQIGCCNCGCCGQEANFPGGGSPNRIGGSGMCCSSKGGDGLIIVSWE